MTPFGIGRSREDDEAGGQPPEEERQAAGEEKPQAEAERSEGAAPDPAVSEPATGPQAPGTPANWVPPGAPPRAEAQPPEREDAQDWVPGDQPKESSEIQDPQQQMASWQPESGAAGDAGEQRTEETSGAEDEQRTEEQSRVSVVSEPNNEAGEDEYKWHTGTKRPTGMPDAVEFIDVYKAFGPRARILRGLNMGLPEGKISMILGPSGTGKSVCIKHMVGLLYPDEGDVLVHGDSVPNMQDDDLFEMRKKFGVLFQDGALFGSMNVFDNTAFPLRQHTDKPEEEIAEIVNRRLREVGLADANDRMPNELSGGMRKRAGFARALVLDPDIVLFDEPDSGLDPVRTALLGELIQEIHADMMSDAESNNNPHPPAFTIITHDIMTARRVAEHISVLWKGRIVESGPAEELFNSDNAFVRQFLSGESQGPLGME
jgi:phospholipid/cholesterol/gamma-HCH transport system ATP-binding protein